MQFNKWACRRCRRAKCKRCRAKCLPALRKTAGVRVVYQNCVQFQDGLLVQIFRCWWLTRKASMHQSCLSPSINLFFGTTIFKITKLLEIILQERCLANNIPKSATFYRFNIFSVFHYNTYTSKIYLFSLCLRYCLSFPQLVIYPLQMYTILLRVHCFVIIIFYFSA